MEYEEGDTVDASSGDEVAHNDNNASSDANPKKRKREKHQKTSCELCKARKVKCDRAEPACSWCARHNRTCVYLERQKPGSRIGFGLELEAKVNKIDALLQSLGRRLEDHIESHDSPHAIISGHHGDLPQRAGVAPSTAPSGTPTSQNGPLTGYWPGSDAPDVSQYGIQPPIPPPVSSQQQHSKTHKQQQQPPPNSIPPASTPYSHGAAPSPSVTGQRPAPALTDLPPQDVIYTLVDLYFKHCNTWCPILDRKSTFGIFFGSTSMGEADRVLLHAIVATTLRFLRDPRLSYEAKLHYHAVSKRNVQLYAMENVSIDAIKALVILCLDELGTSNGPRGWNMLSMLAQNIRQLNLGDETAVFMVTDKEEMPGTGSVRRVITGRPESWIEDEGRRRICWMVYLLDRYATIATADFDFLLEEVRMKRLLPCSYDLFSRNVPVETQTVTYNDDGTGTRERYTVNRPENLGSFAYHCEILRIVSRIHNFLRTPVDVTSSTAMSSWVATYNSLDSSLDAWLQSLPSEYSKVSALCHSDPASRVANWFMLHSAYVVAVVRLHSAAAYPTVRSAVFMPSHYATQRCLSAVQSLGDIARDVYEADGLDLLGPPFAFSLWVAARLLLVHAATVGCAVDPQIEFLIETLNHVGQYWELANNYAKVLTRAVQMGRQSGYAAMRKNAHDIMTLTSRNRRSGIEPLTTRVTSPAELDNMDLFNFFNVPALAEATAGQTTSLLGTGATGALPDPERDWLRYGTPYG